MNAFRPSHKENIPCWAQKSCSVPSVGRLRTLRSPLIKDVTAEARPLGLGKVASEFKRARRAAERRQLAAAHIQRLMGDRRGASQLEQDTVVWPKRIR